MYLASCLHQFTCGLVAISATEMRTSSERLSTQLVRAWNRSYGALETLLVATASYGTRLDDLPFGALG